MTELEGNPESHPEGFRPVGDVDPDPDAGADAETAEDNQTVLMLQDPDDLEHWMARDLPREAQSDGLSDDEVVALARDVDRRQLTDPGGKIWRIERIEKPAPVREGAQFERAADKVRISAEGGPERMVELPEGRLLGTLTREELVDLIGAG